MLSLRNKPDLLSMYCDDVKVERDVALAKTWVRNLSASKPLRRFCPYTLPLIKYYNICLMCVVRRVASLRWEEHLMWRLFSRIVALSDEVLLKMTRAQSLSVISVLSLHGNGLIRLKHLQALTRLKRLTVTYNDLTKLDDLAGMVGSSALPVSLLKS